MRINIKSSLQYLFIIGFFFVACGEEKPTEQNTICISVDSMATLQEIVKMKINADLTDKKYKTMSESIETYKKEIEQLRIDFFDNRNDTKILEQILKQTNACMDSVYTLCDDYEREPALQIQNLRNNTLKEMKALSGFYAYIITNTKTLNQLRDSLNHFKDSDIAYQEAQALINQYQAKIIQLQKENKDKDIIINQRDSIINNLNEDIATVEMPIIIINEIKIKQKSPEIIISFTVNWQLYKEKSIDIYFRVYPAKEFKQGRKKSVHHSENYLNYAKIDNFEYSCLKKIEGSRNTSLASEIRCLKSEKDYCIAGEYYVQIYLNKKYDHPYTEVKKNAVMPKK